MPTPLDRVYEAAGCRTQTELAKFLGMRQSSISDAKKRGSIPADWLLTLWRKKGVNPDWILTGHGPKGLRPVDSLERTAPHTVYIKEILPPAECSVEELMIEVVRRANKASGGIKA